MTKTIKSASIKQKNRCWRRWDSERQRLLLVLLKKTLKRLRLALRTILHK